MGSVNADALALDRSRWVDRSGSQTARMFHRIETADLQASLTVVLVGAAVIHLAVASAHLREYTVFGVFFVAAAVLQLGAAWLCWRRATRTGVWASALLSGVIAAVWGVSRTVGLPFGPQAGEAEAVGLADLVATIYEVIAAGVAVPLAARLVRGQSVRMRMSARASTWALFACWTTVGAIFVGHGNTP